jgi:transcriptional regulator with GAF, ATPase, and Fis domain/predicted hydrocarbon binding protein
VQRFSDEEDAMVQAKPINLANLLQFAPEEGQIRLKDYRMVMLSADALGCLRKELIETVGWDEARALLKRFGHAAGLADGRALAERFPAATPDQHMDYGPALHSLEGVARVIRDESKSEIDLQAGRYHVEAYWENSYEAEQHLRQFGRSEAPVCWTLAGYATGHSSSAAGRDTVVVETECKAMGYDRCRLVIGFADDMPDEARRENADYQPHHLTEVMDQLLGTIRKQKQTLRTKERAISRLQSEMEKRRSRGQLLGTSGAMKEALDLAGLVAPVDTTVLILGESGTGKELLARSIHDGSPRAEKPFVAINCSALPENLQEAELFGFTKGAFTGAVSDSQGLFEAAHGGTLFLDEIGDLSLSAQTKILRALQEGEIKRLGETRVREVNVRVLAATHRDLEAMIGERTFRDDLYYRLSVVTIPLPPLRDRGDDALLLAKHFTGEYARQFSKKLKGLSRAAKCAIAAYRWPGNVRELQNAVQRGVILAQGDRIELADLPDAVLAGARRAVPVVSDAMSSRIVEGNEGALHEIDDEPQRIRQALELAEGNRERAASMLGMSRTTLWRRMKSHGISAATP